MNCDNRFSLSQNPFCGWILIRNIRCGWKLLDKVGTNLMNIFLTIIFYDRVIVKYLLHFYYSLPAFYKVQIWEVLWSVEYFVEDYNKTSYTCMLPNLQY